jgi:hypothetical protein
VAIIVADTQLRCLLANPATLHWLDNEDRDLRRRTLAVPPANRPPRDPRAAPRQPDGAFRFFIAQIQDISHRRRA